MQHIKMLTRTKDHSAEFIWERIANVAEYPQRVKFVKSIITHDIKKGGYYEDITELLWIPIRVHHVVTEHKRNKQLSYYLTLPAKGKMWMDFIIRQKANHTELYAEIKYDLAVPLSNHTVGYILKHRLKQMLISVFPEIPHKDKKVLK